MTGEWRSRGEGDLEMKMLDRREGEKREKER